MYMKYTFLASLNVRQQVRIRGCRYLSHYQRSREYGCANKVKVKGYEERFISCRRKSTNSNPAEDSSLYNKMIQPRRIFSLDYTLANLAGHISFLLLATSYMERDPFRLRELAIGAFCSMSLFQYFRSDYRPLWLPLRWNALFIMINVGMCGFMYEEQRRSRHFPPEEEEIYQNIFYPSGVARPDFLKLMEISEKYSKSDYNKGNIGGRCLTRQGEPQNKLYLMLDGSALVLRDGIQIATIRKNQFFGEISFIGYVETLRHQDEDEDLSTKVIIQKPNATADIRLDDDAILLVWDFDDLVGLLKSRPTLQNTLITSIASDLIKKLAKKEVLARLAK